MKKAKILSIICLAVLLFACGNDKNNENKPDQNADNRSLREETNETEAVPETGDYYFSGLIDHKYAINLRLQVDQKKATGTYYYNSQRKELSLNGTVDGPNLEMDEMVNNKITGHFSGTTYGVDSISGTWESPKGKKLDFVLYKSDKDKYEKYQKEEAPKKFDLKALNTFRSKFQTVNLPFEYAPLDYENSDGKAFTDDEIRMFSIDDYDPEKYWGYYYYYGVTFETENYIALIFTENYVPGAFGIYNQSLVMLTIGKNGDFIDKKYLGCHCMDTNAGINDYYSTVDSFFFTEGNIRIESVYTHATLIEEAAEGEPFEEIEKKTKNVKIEVNGKIGKTGY